MRTLKSAALTRISLPPRFPYSSPPVTAFRTRRTSREKFKIASEDSLDRGTFALAASFGALGQLTNSNKSFGQGGAGFARYFGASYGDLLIGDYMTEAVYPSILLQDPRSEEHTSELQSL